MESIAAALSAATQGLDAPALTADLTVKGIDPSVFSAAYTAALTALTAKIIDAPDVAAVLTASLIAQGLDAPTAQAVLMKRVAETHSRYLSAYEILGMRVPVPAPAPVPDEPTPAVQVVGRIRKNFHINGGELLSDCEELSKIVHTVQFDDEGLLDASVCETAADLLRFWGEKDPRLAIQGCSIARRLARCGSAYVYKLNELKVPESVLDALAEYGKTNLTIAHEGCGLLSILSVGWSGPRKRTMRESGAKATLQNALKNDFKRDALSSL
jgi:hypothetical protein